MGGGLCLPTAAVPYDVAVLSAQAQQTQQMYLQMLQHLQQMPGRVGSVETQLQLYQQMVAQQNQHQQQIQMQMQRYQHQQMQMMAASGSSISPVPNAYIDSGQQITLQQQQQRRQQQHLLHQQQQQQQHSIATNAPQQTNILQKFDGANNANHHNNNGNHINGNHTNNNNINTKVLSSSLTTSISGLLEAAANGFKEKTTVCENDQKTKKRKHNGGAGS